MKNTISLCMIVKNEEEYLAKCLNSIKDLVDEIIIVDTGSKDKTVKIAKKFGSKVYHFKWNNNFSEARNISLGYATKDWILILDADDEFSEEARVNFKKLLNGKLDEKAIYYFETLSYCGRSVEEGTVVTNLNPRLFKNKRGIHYEGEVHNQLIYTSQEYNVVEDSIKIHHYGYLDKRIISQDKRNRNIKILKEQIKNNPKNYFAYFNLGNEYSSLNEFKSALECYYKSYEDFKPSRGYSCVLILRIVISNYNLGNYNEAFKFIDIGLKHYPKCTDLHYYKANVYKEIDSPAIQIRELEKCLELGEPPSDLKFIHGVGSFKASYELGNAYMRLRDYDTAYKYYIETLKTKPDYIDPLYKIIYILKLQNLSIEDFKATVEKFFGENIKNAYGTIADLFCNIEYYETALEYIKKCEQEGNTTESTYVLKAICLMRSGKFEEYINVESIGENSIHYVAFSMYKVLSALIINKYEYAESTIDKFKKINLKESDKKVLSIYTQLVNLFLKKPTNIISESKNEKELINIILDICEILLMNQKNDEFEIAVNLFNLIENDCALLCVGKLYNKYGYTDIAKKEILRSIKEFEVYDVEALDILKL
ncbi:Glycosyltransferase involved in cell wall bisynthesis [Clostridium cavendishii DSM 21758]|uniref:Glycosyltransferase involved in cell wall bisynthesis n=1 Tax=Clostridium cavendishii DSM 21758 TaxID=1121302 RepID=A0A1M6PRK0_9CLOT|nr:glycosyltransferase family 2 protein [Clostridium cavendishii]SHK10594.1 Glycosyltransferase involved in cell wall bisynthesis [Clostridium cavendishii DSM 21758]